MHFPKLTAALTATAIATMLAGPALAAGLAAPAAPAAKTGPHGCALEQIPDSNAYVRADPTCLASVAEGAFDADVAEEHRN